MEMFPPNVRTAARFAAMQRKIEEERRCFFAE
jgi:hypothetical protein